VTSDLRPLIRLALLVIAAILLSCRTVPTPQFRLGGITDTQIEEITPVVRAQTSERILGFQQLANGMVKVKTSDHRVHGSGSFFYLRKVGGKWKIVEESVWDA
jgi:hypothetical protein